MNTSVEKMKFVFDESRLTLPNGIHKHHSFESFKEKFPKVFESFKEKFSKEVFEVEESSVEAMTKNEVLASCGVDFENDFKSVGTYTKVRFAMEKFSNQEKASMLSVLEASEKKYKMLDECYRSLQKQYDELLTRTTDNKS